MSKKRKPQLFILEAVSSNPFEVLTSVLIWYKQLINCSRPQHSVMIKEVPKKIIHLHYAHLIIIRKWNYCEISLTLLITHINTFSTRQSKYYIEIENIILK